MPYINFYFDNIEKAAYEIHILYWNRDLQSENLSNYRNCIFHEFKCYQEDDVSKLSKIGSFLKYRKFALKVLNNENFDFIFGGIGHGFAAVGGQLDGLFRGEHPGCFQRGIFAEGKPGGVCGLYALFGQHCGHAAGK